MTTTISGCARKIGDNINTDQMAPYPFARSWQEARTQMFPENRGFVEQFTEGDIIVAGNYWGCGSSREQEWAESVRRRESMG